MSTLESMRGNCQAGSGHQRGEFRKELSPEAGGGCGRGSVQGGHECTLASVEGQRPGKWRRSGGLLGFSLITAPAVTPLSQGPHEFYLHCQWLAERPTWYMEALGKCSLDAAWMMNEGKWKMAGAYPQSEHLLNTC